jgi:hypothetical protein
MAAMSDEELTAMIRMGQRHQQTSEDETPGVTLQ